ncbi:hypothetical protein ONE63_002226 [Megalurothrips usitatus]|uniref:Mediator of RNA polymerase II transcription subunit 4 n=1 Tax=Megalurothrips usitatus TaxID=439358 RepID=A0AAV7XBS0_9NEOP|nr:hypothetical protein ONE63_002226 [Megalurothrips usitatus]
MANISTGEKLLSLIDDIELISKEILENTIAMKHQKMAGSEQVQLTELLVSKDNELKATLERAREQARVERKMDALRSEVERQDCHIRNLQRQLKEAEQILATAIYQARQKLSSIAKANKRPVPSEDLIKFAHRISSSHAVCAPLTWAQGDPRRPYPTDIEMRQGLLGRLSNLPMAPQPGLADLHSLPPGAEPTISTQNQFSWHPSGDLHMNVPGQGSVAMETRNHKTEAEDVEVMSTDSSSSSSSDSQ